MEKHTESTRQLKVAKEIQKEMAEIIRSKGMAAFGGALVSVSGVKISPDLSVAITFCISLATFSCLVLSIFFSILPACFRVLYYKDL